MGTVVYAETIITEDSSIDRILLVTQQINLLKNREQQWQKALSELELQHDKEIAKLTIEKASKNLLDKASLDILVAKSNVESISIELGDCQQSVNWLEKSVQEIQNQLNILSIFGLKVAKNQIGNLKELHSDLSYQQKLLTLEKVRSKYLKNLQALANNILTYKNENYERINTLLKSSKLLHIKQMQVKDELAFQEQQNQRLEEVNGLYAQLNKIDPAQSKSEYSNLERNIFYTNENANYAYVQSLIARYKDQIQQMKIAVLKSNSISLLNEISDQVQTLTKQIKRLDTVVKSRVDLLDNHLTFLTKRRSKGKALQSYLHKLSTLKDEYKLTDTSLNNLNLGLVEFRTTLDHALQVELSARQGFPTFGTKIIFDLGKEFLLVPALTFQVVKSLYSHLLKGVRETSLLAWGFFIFAEIIWLFCFFFLSKGIKNILGRPSLTSERITTKWLSLEWLRRTFIDLFLIANIIGILYFFDVPSQNFTIIFYLSLVWLISKGLMIISRLGLVETTHETAGHDVKLYHRLKWIIGIGGAITALTVFIHLLPLIYELKTFFDRVFLLLMMCVSLLLLRSSDVVPNLILSHMESRHPYLQKSIRLIGILVPLLMFGNSVIGLCGYVNLIMTVSWYEGVFLIVLIGYLILRGLLTDGMEQLSRIMIQYVKNGWLWTEAFLKPMDTILRITLFLSAWAILFLLYGWDKHSPIVLRLTRLLHYNLATILNSTITPLSIIALFVLISFFYWSAKWIREFVYRLLLSRTNDMGIRNSLAILSQYTVVLIGIFIALSVLGIDLKALTFVASAFAFGIGLGLRDLANNFACGFLILLERPLRVGDIVSINGNEGEVTHIGSRAVTVRTWDHMELVVPNAEIFNKLFTNWTARDNVVRTVIHIKISRFDNPHQVKVIIQDVLGEHKDILKDPMPEVFLKEMNDTLMDFELRYFVNIRQVKSRTSVKSAVLMQIWDAFAVHGIRPPYPQHEIFLRNGITESSMLGPIGSSN
jgi:potassium efflux system protein